VPLFFAVEMPVSWALNSENLRSIAMYFASVFGYIGVALLTTEFVLGTRAVSGLLFRDLSSKLSLHSKLGKYGLLLVFLHPALIVYSYGETLFYSFTLEFGSQFQRNVTFGRIAFIGLIIIWVTSAILKSKIAYRPWKYIHYISYPVLFLTLLHVPEIGSSFNEFYIRAFWYLIVGVVLISSALRLRHIFGFSKYPYEVVANKKISEKIWELDLKATKKNLKIRTGQYVYVQPDLFSEEHPYSVLNHNESDGSISIGYKIFGKFTEKMTKSKVGDTYLIDGPYGVFTEEINVKPDKPAVFIAGGIGVTPFVKHCLETDGDRVLFYAVRTSKSSAYKNILEPVLKNRLIMVVEKDESPAVQNEERGFLTQEIIEKYIDKSKPYEFYICGPDKMMKSTVEILRNIGVPKNRIHLENFNY
jgi:predicted ferric reductase